MSIETIVKARITSSVASIGSRAHAQVLPQGVTYPAIRYQVIDNPRTLHFGGVDTFKQPRIQLTVHSPNYGDLVTALAQIETAFNGWTTTSGGITVQFAYVADDRDLYEPETKLHGRAVDLMVAHHS